jgi:hypothetical protein
VEIVPITRKNRVWVLLDDKYDVSGDMPWFLITHTLECDFRAGFVAGFDVDLYNLRRCSGTL